MGIFKSRETLKKIGNNEFLISETVIVDNQDYSTNGEKFILVKNNGKSNIFLNSKTTEHIIIKSLTDVVVYGDLLIDEEFDEVILGKGSCVEFKFFGDFWYILSSDGIKND